MAFPATASYPGTADYEVNVFLFDGDSLSLGTAGGGAPFAMHNLMSAASNYAGKGQFRSIAVGGTTVAQMVSTFHNTKPFRTKFGHGFLFIWGGANTGASTFADLQAYWALARADGWRIVAYTILPQNDDTAPDIALKLAINTSIRAASAEWDYLLDVATVLTDPSDSVYFSDPTHLTGLGYQTIANYINSTLSLPVL